MKKLTVITSIVIALIVGILCSMACVTVKYELNYKNANGFKICKKDTDVSTEIKNTNDDFEKVENLVSKLLTTSLVERNIHGQNLDTKINQDLSGNSDNYSTTLLAKNYAISIDYTQEQEQIVYYQGDSKVIKHYGYMLILGTNKGYQEIKIYYRTSSGTTNYQNNPMLIMGNTTNLINFIENYAK